MRTIKMILIVVLVLVTAAFCLTNFSQSLTGANVGPTISCGSDVLDISVSDPESALLTGITAQDRQDGDLTARIQIQGVSKMLSGNTAKVTYLVFDSDGNMASLTRRVRYTDYEAPRFEVKQQLRYASNESIELLDRLQVTDAIDGDITNNIRVSSLSGTSDPEIYTVSLQVTNSMGDTSRVTLPVILESGTAVRPEVKLGAYLVYLQAGSSFSAQNYLLGVETTEGSGNTADVDISGQVDTSTPGTYMVYYRYYHNTTVGTSVLTVVVE